MDQIFEIGLKSMGIYDGSKTIQGKPRPRGIYVILKDDEVDIVGHLLRVVLKSAELKELHRANIHLIPKFDYSLPMGDREK